MSTDSSEELQCIHCHNGGPGGYPFTPTDEIQLKLDNSGFLFAAHPSCERKYKRVMDRNRRLKQKVFLKFDMRPGTEIPGSPFIGPVGTGRVRGDNTNLVPYGQGRPWHINMDPKNELYDPDMVNRYRSWNERYKNSKKKGSL